MTKEEISKRLLELQRQERRERSELLKEHNEKYYSLEAELVAQCEATGHKFEALPNNGVNAPHFVTGRWPTKCIYCGKRDYA